MARGRPDRRSRLRAPPPLDRAANGGDLVRRRLASRGDGAHGLEELAARAGRGRRGAAFVEAAAIFELEVAVVAEEIGRAQRAIGARNVLGFVMKVGELEIM